MKRPALLLLALAAFVAAPAQAALYRCGNVFQDRPCDGSTPITPAAAPAAAGAPSPTGTATATAPAARVSNFGPACARIGTLAQQVQWKREGGATLENQLAEASSNSETAAVVQAVYARRGTAPEIRAAIEAECVQRKEAASAAAEQLRLLQEAAGSSSGVGGAVAVRPAAPSAPETASAAATGGARDARGATCDALRQQHKDIEGRMRAGSNTTTMDGLRQQQREVEASLRRSEC